MAKAAGDVQNDAAAAGRPRRTLLYPTAIAVVLLAASPALVNRFRPARGYTEAVIGLMNPELAGRLQTLDDIQRRKVDFEVDYFGYRYRGNTGNLVDAYTYYFGAYEKPELSFMRDSLVAVGPSAVMLDAGANLGLYTLVASRYAKQVHAFEPYPPVLSRLRANLEFNHVSNVVVHPVGLGSETVDLPFTPPPDENLGTGTFMHSAIPSKGEAKLRVVSGDAFLRDAGISRVDFIKMDIEGFEKPALAGLRDTIRQSRPIVLLEVTVRPATTGLFTSASDLRAAFPSDYELLDIVTIDRGTGAYRLRPLTLRFDRDGRGMVVARPRGDRQR
jgi:FkbM family methyltransferase